MSIKKNLAVSDNGFLFNPSTGDSFSLNPIGAVILKALQSDNDDSNIIDDLLSRYMIDRDTLEKDLYDFKRSLKSHKLLNDE